MTSTDGLVAGIELGGTKVVCALGTGPGDVRDRTVVPTTTPEETLGAVVRWVREREMAGLRLTAVGVASFGPVGLDLASEDYGAITSTPKPGWSGTDVVGTLRRALDLPVGWDTDVNAAALAEHRWGAGQDVDPLVYLTVGTGIGGGAVIRGEPLHGLLHPEMGHVHVEPLSGDDHEGTCPFHGRCAEGMASGPALAHRFGGPLETLGAAAQARAAALGGYYVGQVVAAVVCVLSPRRVVIGGGVAHLPGLLPAVREETRRRLGGYVRRREILDGIAGFVVPPDLGDDAGVLGAVALGLDAVG